MGQQHVRLASRFSQCSATIANKRFSPAVGRLTVFEILTVLQVRLLADDQAGALTFGLPPSIVTNRWNGDLPS